MKGLLLLCGLLLFLSGCAGHVLSEAALENVDPAVEFAEVMADPQSHTGKTLLLGGEILGNRVSADGSTLEILRYTLDRYGYPLSADEDGGRFLVRSARFIDPEIYREGLLITLTGTVLGKETRQIEDDGYEYTYPLFSLGEIRLSRRTYLEPFYSYDYYYYDPFYRPFYRPYYPYFGSYPFWRSYPPYWW